MAKIWDQLVETLKECQSTFIPKMNIEMNEEYLLSPDHDGL